MPTPPEPGWSGTPPTGPLPTRVRVHPGEPHHSLVARLANANNLSVPQLLHNVGPAHGRIDRDDTPLWLAPPAVVHLATLAGVAPGRLATGQAPRPMRATGSDQPRIYPGDLTPPWLLAGPRSCPLCLGERDQAHRTSWLLPYALVCTIHARALIDSVNTSRQLPVEIVAAQHRIVHLARHHPTEQLNDRFSLAQATVERTGNDGRPARRAHQRLTRLGVGRRQVREHLFRLLMLPELVAELDRQLERSPTSASRPGRRQRTATTVRPAPESGPRAASPTAARTGP